MVQKCDLTIRRAAGALAEPVSSVGRWAQSSEAIVVPHRRARPVSDDPSLRQTIRDLCNEDRHRRHGHRMIRAVLVRRLERPVARKTVALVMREEGLSRPKIWVRPHRPRRVARMRPSQPNEAWQIDMTSFQLSNLTPLFLVTVIDCRTREIVGWNLDRRCRASEWTSAVRAWLWRRAGSPRRPFARG